MRSKPPGSMTIRRCSAADREAIFAIVNAAAEAYRGVIPADRWHDPYMPMSELEDEIAAGVEFWGYEDGGELVGVMGIQDVGDVDLIRHAYVLPRLQGRGIGRRLMERLTGEATRPLLVGTWAAAGWAIRFYERHGFEPVGRERSTELLRRYWKIPERQIETSVVLARPSLG
jgi:GNAT superfamily N-acetyltransferase